MRRVSLSFLVSVLAAALLGGLVGALAYAALLDESTVQQRGQLVKIFHSGDLAEPLCVTAQHFCVVELDTGETAAFYTYDTHLASGERSCDIAWLPEFRFVDPTTGENTQGWFRSGCSGTTYRMNGERVFGPGPRDMDRFSVKERSYEVQFEGRSDVIEYLEVDRRSLICGDASPGAPEGCEWAPLPQ